MLSDREREREFEVIAHYGKKFVRLGLIAASNPIEAIKKARERRGFVAAADLDCQEHELTWEVEEDF